MIQIYCNAKHNSSNTLCEACCELLAYAHARLEKCQYGENKPTCKYCTTHCYKSNMRNTIREVMRYSGPRMILHYPKDALIHILNSIRTNYEK